MNCPGCGANSAAGQERCGVCSAVLAPGVEGNLAPKLEPIRELPALRRRDRDKEKEREKNWKDEVSERVKRRRTARTATRSELAAKSELPLFRDLEDAPAARPEAPVPPESRSDPVVARVERPGSPDADSELDDLPLRPLEELFEAPGAAPAATVAAEEFPADAPDGRMELGTLDAAVAASVTLGEEAAPRRTPREVPRFALEVPAEEEPLLVAPAPRLQPAPAFERLSAGAVDALVLGLLASVVLYFTLRLTRVGLPGLLPTWPWLGGYLALVALAYATYFSGTTGQTPGKMLTGIRVVDGEGRPPSYLRAFLRAALAGLGIAALGVGLLPLLLDSRSGALHDRLTGTRVVKG